MTNNHNIAADRRPWVNQSETPFIQIKNISKNFDGVKAVDAVSLDIYKGEFFALLGGSGCGKSTLLRILAGLEMPDAGEFFINGVDMLSLPANKRPINMMFQSYALFPHMDVKQNISFGLEQENLSKAQIAERVEHYLHLVQLGDFAWRKPNQLSGGQRQRVALARCLIKQPQLILLDEPMAALDNKLREQTQFELVALQEQLNLTMMVVTHDQKEAMALSTRIGVMHQGDIVQIGEPSHIYNQPNSHFVADFIGSANFFTAIIKSVDAASTPNSVYCIESDFGTLNLTAAEIQMSQPNSGANSSNMALKMGQSIEMAIRPEYINMHPKNSNLSNPSNHIQTSATVDDIAFMGDHSIYRLKLKNGQTCMVRSPQNPISWGDEIVISWPLKNTMFLVT